MEPLPAAEPDGERDAKQIVVFDLETTGTDVGADRIVSFAATKCWLFRLPGLSVDPDDSLVFRCNPGRPIPPEATAVHGISDDDVEFLAPFREWARRVEAFIGDLPLAGFNAINFDVPLLCEELYRAGVVVDFNRPILDPFVIFRKEEERTLAAAVKFYCGYQLEDAHDAMADAGAAAVVLLKQLARYPNLSPMGIGELASYCSDGRVDLAGKLTRNKEGRIVFAIGKDKGAPVVDDMGRVHSFARWMMEQGFSVQTKLVLERVMQGKLK